MSTRQSHSTGSRWRYAAAIMVSFVPVLASLGTPLQALPAGITVHSITPLSGVSLLAARTAGHNPLDPATFQLKADVALNNTSPSNKSVTSVTISYPGSALGSFTYQPLSFPDG